MNAKQLKDSILQYAMQGNLFNDFQDNAITLYENIKVYQQKQIESKLLKKDNQNYSVNISEIPFDIPYNWKWVKIGDVFNVKGGKRVPRGYKLLTRQTPYVYLRVADMKEGSITSKDLRYVDEEIYQGIKTYTISSDDLYLTIAGTIGRVGMIPKEFDGALLTENAVKIVISNVDKHFIKFLLESPIVQDQFQQVVNKVAQPKLSIRNINQVMIPLPPITVQLKLVEILNELEKKIDLYNKAKLSIDSLNKIFPINLENSILQYAMQGKLAKQSPNDESAQQLVENIQLEKDQLIKDKVIKKEKSLAPITEDEIPYDIPSTWEWVRLGEICSINPRNSADDEINAGFIPMKLIEDGAVNKHTHEIRQWKEIKKGYTHFQENDIVVAKITPCFENRKSAIIRNLPNGIGAGTTELFVLRPYSQLIEREYLLWIFKSHDFISGGKNSFSGTAGQQRVSKSYIENYLIPLPPFKEQKRIVEAIERMIQLKKVL